MMEQRTVTTEAAKPVIVRACGSQTLPHIAATHAALLPLLGEGADIAVDCSDASEIDLTFIQLLIAARKQAGAGLRLAHPPNETLLSALRRGGFMAYPGEAERGVGRDDLWGVATQTGTPE